MLSYPAGLSVSNRALITMSDALRRSRTTLRTRWRRLSVGEQALLGSHLHYPERATTWALQASTAASTP